MATLKAVKSRSKSSGGLHSAIQYAMQKGKTLWQDRQLVTGHNCVARCAWEEMMTTKRQWRKTEDVQFYHFVQSFSPEEDVSPEEVHAIGLELAEKLFPNFEVLVATHTDVDHLHTHLIVNSVSFVDGRKLHQNAADLQRQRQISDELCAAHGLTVLEPPKKYGHGKGMGSKEYRSAAKGESWKFQLINTIDLCMRRAKTKEEFIREMERRGYQIRWEEKRKAITYTTPRGMKCRDDRLHDKKYKKEVMEREFRIREQMVLRGIEAEKPAARGSSGGDRSSAGLPHTGAVGADGDVSGRSVPSGSETAEAVAEAERVAGEDLLRPVYAGEESGAADAGSVCDPLGGGTGWEQEREEAFSLAQTSDALSGMAVGHPDLGGVVGGVVRFGSALERTQQSGPAPVSPVTHGDRKALAKEKEKKIAMGHKPDDYEEQQQQQTM